jgi:hypothetical protein
VKEFKFVLGIPVLEQFSIVFDWVSIFGLKCDWAVAFGCGMKNESFLWVDGF